MIDLAYNWTEKDLEALISEKVEEGQGLDYKRSDSLPGPKSSDIKKFEFCKDVSAFANASGGVLIYGITEEEISQDGKKNKFQPVEFDEGVDPAIITKEHLSRILNSGIQRRLEYTILPIKLDKNRIGKVSYVIVVPQSKTAHQVIVNQDYRYYRRYETEILRMQDYEIRDVMNRLTGPDLWIDFSVLKENNYLQVSDNQIQLLISSFLVNKSLEKATHYILNLYLDSRILPLEPYAESSFFINNKKRVIARRIVKAVCPNVPIFGNQLFEIYNGNCVSNTRQQITLQPYEFDNFFKFSAYIKWELEAPNMIPRYGIHEITFGPTSQHDSNDFEASIYCIEKGLIQ